MNSNMNPDSTATTQPSPGFTAALTGNVQGTEPLSPPKEDTAALDGLNKVDEYSTGKTYGRVVLEGSKIIISCPHLLSTVNHDTLLGSSPLWLPDELKPEAGKQFAPDATYQQLQPLSSHPDHRHHYRRHQRSKLASHFDSSQTPAHRAKVKWFRNHLPLVDDYDYLAGEDERNSYNSTTYGVPLVTQNRADSTGYVKSLHGPQQTTASFTPSQLEPTQNEPISLASSVALMSLNELNNEFVLTSSSNPSRKYKANSISDLGQNLKRQWYISETGALVMSGTRKNFSGLYTCRTDAGESSIVLDVLQELNERFATKNLGRDRAYKISTVQPATAAALDAVTSTRSDLAVSETENHLTKSEKTQTDDVPSSFNTLPDPSSSQKQVAQDLIGEIAIDSNRGSTNSDSSFEILQESLQDPRPFGSNEESTLRGESWAIDGTKNEAKKYVMEKLDKSELKSEKTHPLLGTTGKRLKSVSLTNLHYMKGYIHVVKNEAIKKGDLKFIPGFLYNKLQLYCPIKKQQNNLPLHILVELLCPKHLKQFGKMNRRIECQHLAKRLIRQVVFPRAHQQLSGNCSASIFDLVWFKNGKRLEFKSDGRVLNSDLNMKAIDPLIGLEFGPLPSRFERQRFLTKEPDLCQWSTGRVLELEGPSEESAGRYMCGLELNMNKLRKSLQQTTSDLKLLNLKKNLCCDGETKHDVKFEAFPSMKADIMSNNETSTNVYMYSIKNNDPANDSMDNRIFLLNSILINEVITDQALDLIELLLMTHQRDSISSIQTFSLSISERPASFSNLWSTIIQADHAYARRKRADFKRLKQDFREHVATPSSSSYFLNSNGQFERSKQLSSVNAMETHNNGFQEEEPIQPFAYDERGQPETQPTRGVILESGAKPFPFPLGSAEVHLGGSTGRLTSQQLGPDMLLNNADELLNKNIAGRRGRKRARRQVGTFMREAHFNYADEKRGPNRRLTPQVGRGSGFGEPTSGCKFGHTAKHHRAAQDSPPRKVKLARRRRLNERASFMDMSLALSQLTTNKPANQVGSILIEASSGSGGGGRGVRRSNNNHDKTQDPIIDDNFPGNEFDRKSTLGGALSLEDAATDGRLAGRRSVTSIEMDKLAVKEESVEEDSRKNMEYEELGGAKDEEPGRGGSMGRAGLQEDKLQHSGAVTHRHSASQLDSFSTQSSEEAEEEKDEEEEEAGRQEESSGGSSATIAHSVASQSGHLKKPVDYGSKQKLASPTSSNRLKIDKSNQELGYHDTSLGRETLDQRSPETLTSSSISSSSSSSHHQLQLPQLHPTLLPYGTTSYESSSSSANGNSLIEDGLMWQASQYLYMHMKAVASSSIFGVEVAVEWSNELTNVSAAASSSSVDLAQSLDDVGNLDDKQRQPGEPVEVHPNYLREVPFATIDVISGQDLQLQCTAQAMGRLPEVRWYKRISTLPSQLKGLISLARKIGNDLYWPLTELDLLTNYQPASPKAFVCSKSTAIFNNLVNQTFTVVDNLQLSHYNDFLHSDPIKSISLSSILTHNTYACIVDADVRHNYATLGVNFRKTPTSKLASPIEEMNKRIHKARSASISQHQSHDLLANQAVNDASHRRAGIIDSDGQEEEAMEARFDLLRNTQLMFPIRSWTYLHNGSSAALLDKQMDHSNNHSLSLTPFMLILVIAFVLTIVSALIHLTIRTYRNLTRFSSDDFTDQTEIESQCRADALVIESLNIKPVDTRYKPPNHPINTSCIPIIDERGLSTGCSCSREQMQYPSSLYNSLLFEEEYELQNNVSQQEQILFLESYTTVPTLGFYPGGYRGLDSESLLEGSIPINTHLTSQASSNISVSTCHQKQPVTIIENPSNFVSDQVV